MKRQPELRRDATADVEISCRRIADYLLELAREGEIDEALGSLLDAIDRGLHDLDVEARVRAKRIHDRLEEKRVAAHQHDRVGRGVAGQGCDPYFWG